MTKEEFVRKLKEAEISLELFTSLTFITEHTIKFYWLSEKCKIPNYVEPILDLLIELKAQYLASGGNYAFLNKKSNVLNEKQEELLKELEKSKKVFTLIKENKALEAKILKLKTKFIRDNKKNQIYLKE
ncbi:hypothetical protein CXJ37_05100 [Campylobacter upsaliensis]|nr:hypothetical protein [Campylobacter upsaliensis]